MLYWLHLSQVLGYLITGCTVVALPAMAATEAARRYLHLHLHLHLPSSRYPETSALATSLLLPTKQWGPNHYQACEGDRALP